MRTHLEFISDAFPAEPGEEQLVNAGRYGKRLAEFLSAHLPDHGFTVEGISPEDWGWRLDLQNADFPLWVGCGNYEWVGNKSFGDDPSTNGFLCFIDPSEPSVRSWFKSIDTRAIVERLAAAMQQILEGGGVRQMRWWDEDEVGLSH